MNKICYSSSDCVEDQTVQEHHHGGRSKACENAAKPEIVEVVDRSHDAVVLELLVVPSGKWKSAKRHAVNPSQANDQFRRQCSTGVVIRNGMTNRPVTIS